MESFPVWGKELSYKVRSCNVCKSSDSQSPGGRDRLIPAASSHGSPLELIFVCFLIMCSKTPPLFGVFSATQASPSQGKGFPAFLRAGVYSQIQVLTVRYAAWRLRLGRQQIEEAGAGNCFLLRESMGPWAAGGSRVWAFQGQGCELCAVMPPIGVSSEAIHSVVLVRPRSCGPQALPSHPPGLF